MSKLEVKGEVCLYHTAFPYTSKRGVHNDQLYEAATAIQKLVRGSPDGRNWYIGGMYIEFDNSGSAVDPIPVFDLDEGLSYYNNLSSATDRDYLRVPLFATSEDTSSSIYYPNNNIAIFSAQTSGSVGVHGKSFSDTVNSNVYGGALVIFEDEDDPSQDVVFSRFYLSSSKQIPKIANSSITLIWKETFTVS